MNKSILEAACILGLSILSTTALHAEDSKDAWAKFKVGSWKKTKTVMKMEGAINMETTTFTTTKLTEVTPKDYALEITTETSSVINGAPPAASSNTSTVRIPLEAGPSPSPAPAEVQISAPETGSESITVAGKAYDATWSKVKVTAGGVNSVTQTWLHPDVPGGDIKSVTTPENGPAMTTELVEFQVAP